MNIALHGRWFAIRSRSVSWGYLDSRTVLHVSRDAERFLVENQDRLGINCVPGIDSGMGRGVPVMVVTSRTGQQLEEVALRIFQELQGSEPK